MESGWKADCQAVPQLRLTDSGTHAASARAEFPWQVCRQVKAALLLLAMCFHWMVWRSSFSWCFFCQTKCSIKNCNLKVLPLNSEKLISCNSQKKQKDFGLQYLMRIAFVFATHDFCIVQKSVSVTLKWSIDSCENPPHESLNMQQPHLRGFPSAKCCHI